MYKLYITHFTFCFILRLDNYTLKIRVLKCLINTNYYDLKAKYNTCILIKLGLIICLTNKISVWVKIKNKIKKTEKEMCYNLEEIKRN